jgi:hypothetical protein
MRRRQLRAPPPVSAPVRCALYTRKSNDESLQKYSRLAGHPRRRTALARRLERFQ